MESGFVDYLGCVGKSINAETTSAIKIGLAALSRQLELPVKYWGFVEGIQQDYHVAQSGELSEGVFAAAAARDGNPAKAQLTYYSADGGVRWQQLEATSSFNEEQYEYCEQLRGPFIGDPQYEYKIQKPLPSAEDAALMKQPELDEDGNPIINDDEDAGAYKDDNGDDINDGEDGEDGENEDGDDGEDGDEGDDAKPKKKKQKFRILVMKETVRLAHFIAVRDAQCRLIPRGAFVTRDDGATASLNPSFTGLSVENSQRLAHYLHAGAPAATLAGDARRMVLARNKELFGALHHPSFDFLPSAAEDMPHGTWSVKYNASLDVAILHNLLFKGSYFFHKPGTSRFWSVYAGNGQRLLDLAFVLP